MNKINNIAKNTSYLTLALVFQKIISFTYFIILARSLGQESLGKYYLAISITTIFAIFIDLGLVNVLTREVAKNQKKAEKLLGNVLSIKVPLSFLAIIVTVITVFILGYSPFIKQLVYISTISMVLDSFTTTFFSVSRGFHNLFFESLSAIFFQVIVMACGLLALSLGLDLRYIMLALAIASVCNFIYSFLILKLKIKLRIRFLYERICIKNLITLAWPFGAYAILQRLYTYLDTVLLSVFVGERYVGIYQVPFKIIFALQFLPLAFTASLYPALSYYWLNNKEQLETTFIRAINYLIIISVPIIFGTIFLADKIVLLFSDNFIEAVLPLQIIIISLFFIFLNYPIGSLLNACDKQKKNTQNMAITTVVSIILNVILIPKFNVLGASIAVLFTNFLMFIFGIYWVRKVINYKGGSNLKVFIKSFLASAVMALFIYLSKTSLNIFLLVLIAMIIYFLFLVFSKTIGRDDILSILKSFKLNKS